MSIFSEIFGGEGGGMAEQAARRQKELSFAYKDFRWKAEPLLVMGKTEELTELFVKCTVDSQMKNTGEEGQILLEYDRIVKRLVRKPREKIRRGAFDDI